MKIYSTHVSEKAVLFALLTNDGADDGYDAIGIVGGEMELHILESAENHIREGWGERDRISKFGCWELVFASLNGS